MGTRRPINGNDIVLAIDPLGGTSYTLIVCLESNSIASTTAVIDANSKCGPYKMPGVTDNKIALSIIDWLDTTNSELSSADLFDLQQAKTTVGWKYGKVTPVAGDETYTGTGFLANWNNTAALNTAVKTTADLEVQGTITRTRTGS